MKKTAKKKSAKKPTRKPVKHVPVAAPPVAPKPIAAPRKVLVLRTCDKDLKGHGGFQWPRSGPVECPDWDPQPTCGNGLHGFAWGEGDWSLMSSAPDAVWMVVEVMSDQIVKVGADKVKFPRGTVVYAGVQSEAIHRVLTSAEAMAEAQRAASEWGEKCGYYSKAASSGTSSKAASSGTSSTAASSGTSSKAASSGDYSTAASSGDYSTAASSGTSSKAASSGYSSIAATIGDSGMAKAGPLGLIIVTYWVAAEKRYRACVGNVGEGGILADTWYRVKDGHLEAVQP